MAKKKDTTATQITEEAGFMLRPIQTKTIEVRIVGVTTLITNQWSKKAKAEMRQNQTNPGSKSRIREPKNIEQCYEDAQYRMADGSCGFPVTGIKRAMFEAAHKDIGVAKKLISRALFIQADEGELVRIESPDGPKMREDLVRVGMKKPDLRYRPEFPTWAMQLRIEYDTEALNQETIFNLLERAGFGIGLGEWRPQCNGENGRFRVARKGDKK